MPLARPPDWLVKFFKRSQSRLVKSLRRAWGLRDSVKPLADLAAIIAVVVSVYALAQQIRSQQWSEALGREDKIRGDIQSNDPWVRMSGLEALASLPYQYAHVVVPDGAQSLAPFEVAKRIILEHFSRFEVRDEAARSAAGQLAAPALAAREKWLAISAMSELGAAGWYKARPLRPMVSSERQGIDLHWMAAPKLDSGASSPDPRTTFMQKDLGALILSNADASCVSFAGSILKGWQTTSVALFAANLSDADLTGADLKYIDINRAKAANAKFVRAEIEGLSANEGGHLHQTLVVERYDPTALQACLSGEWVSHDYAADLTGVSFADASVDASDFGATLLQDADFTGSHVYNTTFAPGAGLQSRTQMQGARFTQSDLHGVDFTGADLSGSSFAGAVLEDVTFNAQQTSGRQGGADLDYASFKGSKFTSSASIAAVERAKSVKGANFSGATLDPATLCRLLLAGGVLIDDEAAWNRAGRPLKDWRGYTTPADAAIALRCALPGGRPP